MGRQALVVPHPASRDKRGSRRGILHTLCVGTLVSLGAWLLHASPAGQALHEQWAVPWLYALRGQRSTPPHVAVINLDRTTTSREAESGDHLAYRRGELTDIIHALSTAGTCVIVLDVAFEQKSTRKIDSDLANAIRASRRTVIFQRLRRIPTGDIVVPPTPRVADAASAIGVLPLPKVPGRVDYYWQRFPALVDTGTNAFDVTAAVSLPAAARNIARVRHTAGHCSLLDNSQLGSERPSGTESLVRRDNRVRLNFYGPAHTVSTLHKRSLLKGNTGLLEGRIVFVGQSADSPIDQVDGFETVYSGASGLDISGVEIAATALANMLDGSSLQPFSPLYAALSFVASGMFVMLLARFASPLHLAAGSALLCGSTLLGGQLLMSYTYQLLPIAGLLLLNLPLALLTAFALRYRSSESQRLGLQRRASLVVPEQALHLLTETRFGTLGAGPLHTERVVCLITDVAGYTTLAENLPADRLDRLTREYFRILGELTIEHHGELLDVLGDGMTAIWRVRPPEAGAGGNACRAAIAMKHAVERFNRSHPQTPFVTRFGLHAGSASAGHFGAGSALRFRLIGDVMNSTSRLQGLNKLLGTRILLSRELLDLCDCGFVVRPVGQFRLAGKRRPLEAFELCEFAENRHKSVDELGERRDAIFNLLLRRKIQPAQDYLHATLCDYPNDQVCRFYMRLLKNPDIPGVIMTPDGTVSVAIK